MDHIHLISGTRCPLMFGDCVNVTNDNRSLLFVIHYEFMMKAERWSDRSPLHQDVAGGLQHHVVPTERCGALNAYVDVSESPLFHHPTW